MAEKLEQDGFRIPVAVIARWNSQYHTVARILEIPYDKLNDYLRELKKDQLILSQRDIAVLNEFISVFALFAEVCTERKQTRPLQSLSWHHLCSKSILTWNLSKPHWNILVVCARHFWNRYKSDSGGCSSNSDYQSVFQPKSDQHLNSLRTSFFLWLHS